MLFSFISGWSDLLRCPLCIFLCCCRDGTAAAATKADMTYCNNFVSGIMIWCQRKSFFFKSLILHEIMKFLKISFFCTENFWPKISAAILIWGYNSTWKLKIIEYKLPHFANFTSCSKKDFDHSTKIYIHFSFSLTINASSIVRWLKTMFTMFMNSIYSEC